MAARASSHNGAWNLAATWGGNPAPVAGDTVALNHNVNVPAGYTAVFGTTPGDATTFDMVIGAIGGCLTIDAGGQLTCKSSIVLTSPGIFGGVTDRLVVSAGGIFEMDPSPGVVYVVQTGLNHFDETRVRVVGVAGNYAQVRAVAGQKMAINRGGKIDTGHFVFQFAKFTNVSDGANYFSDSTPSSVSVSCTSGVVFEGCGDFYADGGADPGMARTWTNCSWESSTGTQNLRYFGTATGLVNTNVFDKTPVIIGIDTMVTMPTRNFFKELLGNTNSVKAGEMTLNLFRQTTGGGYNAQGNLRRNAMLTDADIFNPHGFEMCADNASSAKDSDDNIIEYNGSSVAGDTHSFSTGTAADRTFNIRGNISLPSGLNGTSEPGTGCSLLANSHVTVFLGHNTYYQSDQGFCTIGETYAGYVGIVSGVKSNLIWSKVGTTSPLKTNTSVPGAVEDAVSAANCDYNAGLNLVVGTEGKGYSSPTSGVPGAHDVLLAADPFGDSSRNMKTWDISLGGPGTYAHAVAELAKINDETGYNAAYNIPDYITYVRDGFKVTALSLKDAGHDGVTIGAMSYQAPTRSASPTDMSLGIMMTV